MEPENTIRITVREAEEADIPALTCIKGEGSQAVHRDRLRDAQSGDFYYYVLLANQELIGYACLVFRRPAHWSDAKDTQHLPQVVDLQVKAFWRGRGYGSEFMRTLQRITLKAGYGQLFISVEPLDNPRAYALYKRLGYEQIQPEPYFSTWEFIDSEGKRHHGENWTLDMVKKIIQLREVDEGDLPIFFEQQKDPDATKMADFPAREREEFMSHWHKILADMSSSIQAIVYDGKVAGNILRYQQNERHLVGYWIGKEFWGKGIATGALLVFLEIVKERPLHAYVSKQNHASRRVLEKCGFTICGEETTPSGVDGKSIEEFIMILKGDEGEV